MNVDHKSLEKGFSFAICRQPGNKRQSKTLFLRSTFVDSNYVLDCRLSEVFIEYSPTEYEAKPLRNKGYYRNNLQSGDKRQSKILFLTILDLRSSIVLTFSIAAYLKCLLNIGLLNTYSQNNPKQGLL